MVRISGNPGPGGRPDHDHKLMFPPLAMLQPPTGPVSCFPSGGSGGLSPCKGQKHHFWFHGGKQK